MRKLILILLLVPKLLSAEIVINEVLSNEPGGSTNLEWIELYNNSESSEELSNYMLVVNSDTIQFSSQIVQKNEFIVVCKKLFSVSTETSFESYWGNNSQIWGDDTFEMKFAQPIEASFSLTNSSGSIELYFNQSIVSLFSWDESGLDGTSWERKFADSDIIKQSVSKVQSTPGYLNSVSLLTTDVSIDSVYVELIDLTAHYYFVVTNRGTTDISNLEVILKDSASAQLYSFIVSSIQSDSTIVVEQTFQLPIVDNYYHNLEAEVSLLGDERIENNVFEFLSVSSDYPPLILSEFLANPQDDQSTEWVEIYNRSSNAHNLFGWSLGDSRSQYPICLDSQYVQPNEYIVLTQSKVEFLIEHTQFSGIVIEPANWAVLNNDSDKIRLIDSIGIISDQCEYSSLFDENFTIVRDISSNDYLWYRSASESGTPGEANKILEYNDLKICLSSKYISPDFDGFEDEISIRLDYPLADSYTLKLYNARGQLVKTFFEDESAISQEYVWDGRGDNFQKLPVGMYIIYFESANGTSVKETVIIAR